MNFVRAFLAAISVATLASAALADTSINAPSKIGAPFNKPFVYLVPATGDGQLVYSALGLPRGLSLDSRTGIISGTAKDQGVFNVTLVAATRAASTEKNVQFVVNSDQATLALTPVMGWNPWYVWGCNIDDKKIRQAADLLVSSGLAAYGYNYINLDDCWQDQRNTHGKMMPNKNFPDMYALADYVHSKGLRIGIYTGPGTKTCGGYMASKDHVEQDLELYAAWGMDFIKYDWCQKTTDDANLYIPVYQKMGDLLAKSPRAMTYMICQYGHGEPWKWGPKVGGNMWRTDDDLADEWKAILRNGFQNVPLAQFQSPGHFNDLDMLMVGKANWPVHLGSYTIPSDPPRPTKLTLDEQLTHMSLWSIMASPLLFSGDLTQLDPLTMKLLTNKEVLAVNQDALAAPARKIQDVSETQVIVRDLADGSKAVAMFNLGGIAQDIRVTYAALGLQAGRSFVVRNLWSHKELRSAPTDTAVKGNVPSHGVLLLKISAAQ